jgi:hypothetical protein
MVALIATIWMLALLRLAISLLSSISKAAPLHTQAKQQTQTQPEHIYAYT